MGEEFRDKIRTLIEKKAASNRGIVEDAKEEIKEALEHGVTIGELYITALDFGFNGSRSLFTRILVEKGLYSMKSKPRKAKGQTGSG